MGSILTSPCLAVILAATLSAQDQAPAIPRTWEQQRLDTFELPNALTNAPAQHVDADYYYSIPATTLFRTYPVYHPDHEPEGYFESLGKRAPVRTFDPQTCESDEDWRRAGELVFHWPIALSEVTPQSRERFARNTRRSAVPATKDGILPFRVYVVREQGKVEIGNLSCAMCHTRVMPDGGIIIGAQGNYPFDHLFAESIAERPSIDVLASAIELFGTPETEGVTPSVPANIDGKRLAAALRSIPPGVMARHGTSAFSPVQIPDLIGVEKRQYLDRTGLLRHRSIGDMMRYVALNQGLDRLSRWGKFQPATAPLDIIPADAFPPGMPPKDVIRRSIEDPNNRFRYSDEQLFALAKYVYGLKPPANPNESSKLTERGREVFKSERCARCHPSPLYTSNELTPVRGFDVPESLRKSDKIRRRGVGTDPRLTLTTRRGTGFYKVPSLLGVWYRGPFSHDGSVASLEDWFDPQRVEDTYLPTGWNPGGKARAVLGHEFGLDLDDDDRRALIAFLRTL